MDNMFDQYTYLYVEDDLLSQEIMQLILVHGMGVKKLTVFADSSDFMERVSALDHTPHIILLDIHIRPLDGFEMLQLLRANPAFSGVKVIALTASVMNEEVERLRRSGFDGAVAKPLSIVTFPTLMQRVIAGEAVWHIA
jgi:two-component system cell cycle response regulator DivK